MQLHASAPLAREQVSTPAVCGLCNGASRPWLDMPGDWRRPHVRQSFRLVRCTQCGVGFLDEMPSADQLRAAYALDYYTHVVPGKARRPPLMDRLVFRVARLADRSAPIDARWLTRHFEPVRLRVCDLGCGSGWLMNRLTQLGHACTGLEVDPEAAEAARSQGLRVLRGSIDAIPEALAKRRFDVVFMLHVLEHCRDPRSALAAASKLLAPGGTLVVEVPNNEALGLERSGIAWPFLDVPRHLWFFTPSSLRDAVERAGLEVQTTEYFGYMRQFTAEWIDEEQRIWDSLRTRARSDASMPPRASRARAYALLARTLVEPPARRHDSVRVLCRR